jgi:hypothetical protein
VSTAEGAAHSAAEHLAPGTAESFEIHPHGFAGLDRAGGILAVVTVAALAAGTIARTIAPGNVRDWLTTLSVVGGLGALLALYMRHYFHTNKLYVTPTVVGQLSALLSRPKEVPRDKVGRLVNVATSPWWARTVNYYLLVVGNDGRCLMRIQSMYYDNADLVAMATAIGVPFEDRPGIIGPTRLQKEIPGALPLIIRHPFELMLLPIVAAAVLSFIGLCIWAIITTACCNS